MVVLKKGGAIKMWITESPTKIKEFVAMRRRVSIGWCQFGLITGKMRSKQDLSLASTPPKFNSSPLKSYRNPIGSRIVFQPPFFRGELLNFRGVNEGFVLKPGHGCNGSPCPCGPRFEHCDSEGLSPDSKGLTKWLGGGLKCSYFHPYLGKISNLITVIFFERVETTN